MRRTIDQYGRPVRALPLTIAVLSILASAPASAFLAGDANHDLRLSAPDVTVMRTILAGTDPGSLEADLNGDGLILDDDLTELIHRLFGAGTTTMPTPTPLPTQMLSPTATASSALPTSTATLPVATFTATPPASATLTANATHTPRFTPTATASSASPTPTTVSTSTVAATATRTPSTTPSATGTTRPPATVTASGTATPTATVTSDPSATSTVRATETASPTPSRTPTMTIATTANYCDQIPAALPIPDDNLQGVTRTIFIDDALTISDLNVDLDIQHTFVGDLFVSLTHVDTGTTVVLLNRPGIPATTDGCGNDDVLASFDSDAGRPAEDACESTPPAIAGSVVPASDLHALTAESIHGTWRLQVGDFAQQDVGNLLSWCLELNSPAPVVTSFTCDGENACTLPLDQPFALMFSFRDPNGDAASWHISLRRDDGVTNDVAQGLFSPLAASGTVEVPFAAFTCPTGNCRTTEFDYSVIVTDATQRGSPALRVHIVVAGSS